MNTDRFQTLIIFAILLLAALVIYTTVLPKAKLFVEKSIRFDANVMQVAKR